MRDPLKGSLWKHVIVIGGGAAGHDGRAIRRPVVRCASFWSATEGGAQALYHRKGRCNVTQRLSGAGGALQRPRNSRFLTSAMTRFPPTPCRNSLPAWASR